MLTRIHREGFLMRPTDVPDPHTSWLLMPLSAMTIVARERQQLHDKIVHLRALREAAEAEKALSATEVLAPQE
jgi:hypothetical protein